MSIPLMLGRGGQVNSATRTMRVTHSSLAHEGPEISQRGLLAERAQHGVDLLRRPLIHSLRGANVELRFDLRRRHRRLLRTRWIQSAALDLVSVVERDGHLGGRLL